MLIERQYHLNFKSGANDGVKQVLRMEKFSLLTPES